MGSVLRLGLNEKLLVVHNFSKETLRDYRVFIPGVLSIEELFNTDSIRFGGKGLLNPLIKKDKEGLFLDLPPLSTLICKVEFSSSPFFFPS
jgi:1,4-alpha-glucan branching enzyme